MTACPYCGGVLKRVREKVESHPDSVITDVTLTYYECRACKTGLAPSTADNAYRVKAVFTK